jgi:hypothetical protein
MCRKLFLLLGGFVVSQTVAASHMVRLDVQQQADRYVISAEMVVDAPVDSVRAILTDYATVGRLSDSITGSRVIGSQRDGGLRVLTTIRNCILFFCRDLRIVEDVVEDEQGRILRSVVPEASSFRSGQASWQLVGAGDTTRIVHHAQLEPDFWIPAWVGRVMVIDTLRREILSSFEKLDCLARHHCATGREDSL